MTFGTVINVLLVAFAFGFVIFWHELGHFLAARWAGVRVEQFAVGMGQAIFSWRKGIGFRPGNTQAEFDRRIDEEIGKRGGGRLPSEHSLAERYEVARDIGLGETDYRFNWIPLGGYVKPTGQDDLRPAAEVAGDDKQSFGAKKVGPRMVIISAGVVMNVILAFALYVVLFIYGFNAPPAVVGNVQPGSPAQAAGLRPGDRILAINGQAQQDFTKLRMNVALLRDNTPATFSIARADGSHVELQVSPTKSGKDFDMPAIGVMQAGTLDAVPASAGRDELLSPALDVLPPGARIVRVGGTDVSKDADDHVLADALNAAAGRAVPVTVRDASGKEIPFDVTPTLLPRFGEDAPTIAGLQPRVRIGGVVKNSPAQRAGVRAGDVVEQIAVVGSEQALRPPTSAQFLSWTGDAGKAGKQIRLTLDRDGRTLDPIVLDPKMKLDRGGRGIGVLPELDLGTPVVAGVIDHSAGSAAGVQAGDRIISVDGRPTPFWPDVLAALKAAGGTAGVELASPGGTRTVSLPLSKDDHTTLASAGFASNLPLMTLTEVRHTTSPLTAAAWGWEETKQSIFQVYTTLRRLVEGSVPLSNLSGPVGIFTAGTSAASHGVDMLIWFTALISANLAVVNFLPIPIVDGGLFTFLLVEKVTGRPPSPRVQTAAQIVGILLLGSLFLFVTYHDILRKWG